MITNAMAFGHFSLTLAQKQQPEKGEKKRIIEPQKCSGMELIPAKPGCCRKGAESMLQGLKTHDGRWGA